MGVLVPGAVVMGAVVPVASEVAVPTVDGGVISSPATPPLLSQPTKTANSVTTAAEHETLLDTMFPTLHVGETDSFTGTRITQVGIGTPMPQSALDRHICG